MTAARARACASAAALPQQIIGNGSHSLHAIDNERSVTASARRLRGAAPGSCERHVGHVVVPLW
jgi:hypothetical protein